MTAWYSRREPVVQQRYRKRLRFPLKPPQHSRAGESGFDDLECHDPAGLLLLGFIHNPHPARTQKTNHPITANPLWQHERDAG